MGALRYAGVGALVVAALVGIAGTGAPERARAGGNGDDRPNVVVIMSDDQTAVSQSAMTATNGLLGDQGATFTNSFVNWPVCCPSRATYLTGQYAHNHQVLGNAPPFGGFGRLDTSETLAVWLQRAGYDTTHIGKFLNGYENSTVGAPPGWSQWNGTKRTYVFYGEQLFVDGQLTTFGSTAEDPDNPAAPENYSTDVFTDLAVDTINSKAPAGKPFFLSLAYLAPHSGGPNSGRCAGSAKPAIRHKGLYDAEPLPQPPSLNEADVTDKPQGIAGRPPLNAEPDQQRDPQLPLPARVAGRRGRGRRARGRRAARPGRARRHPDPLHRRQRLLPRRAPDPDGQEPRLRGGDPRAAADARAGRARGRDREGARRQRRHRADRARRRRAPRRAGFRTAARCSASRSTPSAGTAASC